MIESLTAAWAAHFGLAVTPLFEDGEAPTNGNHTVLLDGGYGSLVLSETDFPLWREKDVAAWAWSSNLPHHVTVTDKSVAITRWDRAQSEVLSRSSVAAQLDTFYDYLIADRVRSNQRVVEHVVGLFRRVRSLVADAKIPDNRSVDAFLAFLEMLMERENGRPLPLGHAVASQAQTEVFRALSPHGTRSLLEDVRDQTHPALKLFPVLAVRHAGSEIFQEAHFELLRAPGLDLFGYAGPAHVATTSREGAHFTPPALARSVVEQTLAEVDGLMHRKHLVVLDPACGSGAFLQEALRALRRLGFEGAVSLVGRDISAAAVSMATFVCRQAVLDWRLDDSINVDISVADSLTSRLPQADVILMNPPFIAWAALTGEQRDTVRNILGHRIQGRSDMSMAFVTLAAKLIYPGGALGLLLPTSLLTLQAAESWRADLLESLDLRLLASLGDYGLFAHALVQVTAAVFAKHARPEGRKASTRALISTDSTEATGEALRALRRLTPDALPAGRTDAWQLFEVPVATIRDRPTWRVISPTVEMSLTRLLESGAVRTDTLFDVRQGIRTGDNKAFLLEEQALLSLPSRERRYFKPAVMNDTIRDGRIEKLHYLFYPYDSKGPVFHDERSLVAAVPQYTERFLLPRKEGLQNRAGHVRAQRSDWWALSWGRESWTLSQQPRLLSKYFGGPGGFAIDLEAKLAVVQGFAWFPKWLTGEAEGDVESALSLEELLWAFVALVNSRVFGRLLALFCPHVAGGQFDLSARYVHSVPLPNFVELANDERAGRLISKLAQLGREPRVIDPVWSAAADRATSDLYGSDFVADV